MILEVQRWSSNAELIEAALNMHVFPALDHPRIIDVTYGKGIWWQRIQLGRLETYRHHDVKLDGVDYRNLPHADGSWDVVFFDPDYIAPGGRKTSTIGEFNERYGLKDSYETPAQLQRQMDHGLAECARIVGNQGFVFMKCSNYISSGKVWLGEYHSIQAGLSIGLKVHDIFVDVGDPGPQPKDRRCGHCKGEGVSAVCPAMDYDSPGCDGSGRVVPRQQHARSNSSRLIVFKKPGRKAKR